MNKTKGVISFVCSMSISVIVIVAVVALGFVPQPNDDASKLLLSSMVVPHTFANLLMYGLLLDVTKNFFLSAVGVVVVNVLLLFYYVLLFKFIYVVFPVSLLIVFAIIWIVNN